MYLRSISITALAMLASTAVISADKDTSALVKQAHELAFGGHYQDAILNFTEALDLQPDDDELRLTLAALLRDTGEPGRAANLLEVAVNAGTKDPRVYLLYGELNEATDDVTARRQYQAAIDADPASEAAVDAVANLEALESDDRAATDTKKKATISWSKKGSEVEVKRLASRLTGQWCLELVDIHHREAGMCMNDPLAGDLAIIEGRPRIDLRIDVAGTKILSTSMESVTDVSIPDTAIDSIDVAVGDHYQVHTVNYSSGEYLNFSLNDGNNSCFQVQQFVRDQELLICPDAYTFCRCE